MKKNTKNLQRSKESKCIDQAMKPSQSDETIGVQGELIEDLKKLAISIDEDELAQSTAPDNIKSSLGEELSHINTSALNSIAGSMFMDKALKAIKLSRKEKKAQKRELALRMKEQKNKTVSIRKQLKNRDKELSSQTAMYRTARKTAKDTVSYIGYNAMYEDGICEIEQGLFSASASFTDTSYQSMRDDLQKGMFAGVNRLYDQFGSDTVVQLNLINTPLLAEEIGARKFFNLLKIENMNAKSDAEIFNEILNQKMKEGVSNIRRDRYITFMVGANTVEEAIPKLARLESESSRILNSIGSSLTKLNGKERLKVLHSQLRPSIPFMFDYKRDVSISQGFTTKDAISPLVLNFKPDGHADSFTTDGIWGRVLIMRKFGSELSDCALSDIVNLPIAMNVTWFVQPMDKAKAIKYVRERAAWIDKEIIDEQGSALRRGYDMNILPLELKYSKEETEDVLDHLQNKNQRLYDFTGLIYTYADSREILDMQTQQIISSARQNSIEVDLLDFRQREGLNSILPLGQNHINIGRKFTTAQLSILMPFATQELDDKDGNYYGQNQHSNNLVFGNRKRLASPVGIIVGKTGSGKGMFAKQEMTGTMFAHPDDEIYCLDRAGEYEEIFTRYGGISYDFSPDSKTYLNPFDTTDVADKSYDAQIAFKVDAIIAQAAANAAEAGQVLSEVDRSIITRCVELAYIEAEKRKNGLPPVLEDFYNMLLEQSEHEAKIIALRYERFVKSKMNFFNNHSNIQWKSRTNINLKELPDEMVVFGLITACEAIRNRMYFNHKRGLRTWLYIEEIQSLFKYPSVLNYFSRFANEGRKYGLLLTGITQNSIALLENDASRNIVLNSDFIMMLKQSPTDRQLWVDLLNLSAQEAGYIDESAEPGDGLLLFGKSRIPIRGRLPKSKNILYDIFSTDPNVCREKRV